MSTQILPLKDSRLSVSAEPPNNGEDRLTMDQRVIPLLQCHRCESQLAAEGDWLSCTQCTARFPVRKGVPILYNQDKMPADLVYDATPRSLTHPQSRLRRRLHALQVEKLAMKLWQVYTALDARMTPRSPVEPEYWMKRVQAALPPSPKVILDLGGGSGTYRGYLATAEDQYLILEVDYHHRYIQDSLDRHQYLIGDGHSPLFADESFDVISMFEVLEHVRNPFQIFANCERWLKPGGVLVLSTPQYWHVHRWPSDYFRYTEFGLRELARTAGLQVVDAWAMGGPCVLIWSVIELNFKQLLRAPLLRQCVTYPALLAALLGDWLFFRNNLQRAYPDTKGWMIIARKPDGRGR